MNKRVFLLVSLVVLSGSQGATAQEQPWLQDRRFSEGIGIRAGDLELHPGVAAEAGYDSNYFQRAPDEDPIRTVRFRLTPSFSVATLGPQRRSYDEQGAQPPKVDFRARGSASYNELIATESEYREAASSQRHLSGQLGFSLDILPSRPWGGDLFADYQRTVEPSNNPDEVFAFDRDAIRAGTGVIWRPGGGLFDWRVGYEFRYNHFARQSFRTLDNQHHYLKTRGRWRFLPRSALIYDAEIGSVSYVNDENSVLNDSRPVRSRIGFNGLITNHFALLAMAGWGASFYRPGNSPVQDYDSIIGQGEFKWFILPQPRLPDDAAKVGLSSVAVGYTRNFTDAYLSDYYQRDRVYLDFSYFIAGTFLVTVGGGYARITYPDSYFADGTLRKDAFGEDRLDAQFFSEYRFSDTVGINLTLRYNANLEGNNEVPVGGTFDPATGAFDPATVTYDNLAFSRFQAFLGVRWFM